MEFKFTYQQYQADAIDSVVSVFDGQPKDSRAFTRDLGRVTQTTLDMQTLGVRNAPIQLSKEALLENIQFIQNVYSIQQSFSLSNKIAPVELDVEMETGTGKTYVYTKTILELNKSYGWSKFIIIVPSVAIREGVHKSLSLTADHFLKEYGKRINFFIYNTNNLSQLDIFSTEEDISVMIINMQAFNSSFNENSTTKQARIIFSEREEFNSRRPIDVIAATNPIVIIDEPQKMGTSKSKTMQAIKQFKPLFTINYSATHKEQHNLVYALDALDAFEQRLVKRIEVKGLEVKNMRGTDGYLYLKDIIVSKDKPPVALIEFKKIMANGSIKKVTQRFNEGDDIYHASGETLLEAYQGYTIASGNAGIVPGQDDQEGHVRFLNGIILKQGEVYGDSSEDDLRRVQIRETIQSHLIKEEMLYKQGIKCLSLFFIDEVAKYRDPNDADKAIGYGAIFEEEYAKAVEEFSSQLHDPDYLEYLNSFNPHNVHLGYFSIDKKNRVVDSADNERAANSENAERAYDLILKDKEKLLSFEQPVRFIFSHSALREGWDNPNIFQICTLKQSSSDISKRQEIGRGLRLCVNKDGVRQDSSNLKDLELVHDVNLLTVIASESYSSFVSDLQRDIRKELRARPTEVTPDFFADKKIKLPGSTVNVAFTKEDSQEIYSFLLKEDLLGASYLPTEKFKKYGFSHLEGKLPEILQDENNLTAAKILIDSVYDPQAIDNIISDAYSNTRANTLNGNQNLDAFKKLWNKINRKYSYTVDFDENELRRNAIRAINDQLSVTQVTVHVTAGKQRKEVDYDSVTQNKMFNSTRNSVKSIQVEHTVQIEYDLIGEISQAAWITRRSAAYILKNIDPERFALFKLNPEEFIKKVSKIIVEQKSTMIVEHISYHPLEERYEQSIFTEVMPRSQREAIEVEKSIQSFIFCDSNIEKDFAKDLNESDVVELFVKLPRSFQIPTPVGNYAPDWAIAFKDGQVNHMFFVAETKGTLDSLQLSGIEQAKINCAKKLFNSLNDPELRYHHVSSIYDLYRYAGLKN